MGFPQQVGVRAGSESNSLSWPGTGKTAQRYFTLPNFILGLAFQASKPLDQPGHKEPVWPELRVEADLGYPLNDLATGYGTGHALLIEVAHEIVFLILLHNYTSRLWTEYQGNTHYFCSLDREAQFDDDP